jgi:hypothetical protein
VIFIYSRSAFSAVSHRATHTVVTSWRQLFGDFGNSKAII